MPTMHKRLNITLKRESDEAIKTIAKRNKVPRAAVAARLIESGLELEEDLALAKLADYRAKTHKGRWLTHEEIWSK